IFLHIHPHHIGVLNIKKARKHYKFASMLDTFALYIYFFNGLPFTYMPHSVKINSLNMEFAQENHALVNCLGSSTSNPSCITFVFASVVLTISKMCFFSSADFAVIPSMAIAICEIYFSGVCGLPTPLGFSPA